MSINAPGTPIGDHSPDAVVVRSGRGDLVVAPPSLAHAFAAAPGHDAELLVIIAPGVERFDYFRQLERIA
jgi:hypothetical protein